VSSEDFSSFTKDVVRSDELASSKGVTSLSNIFLRAPEEAEKEEEEVMSIPRGGQLEDVEKRERPGGEQAK